MLVWMMYRIKFILETFLEGIKMKFSRRKDMCLIYNYAQHYRTNIFQLMDKEFHCDFIFGDKLGDIKKMDYALLSNYKEVSNIRLFGNWYYQTNTISAVRQYKKLFILGELYCLSTWLILFLAPFYHTKIYFWTHGWYGKESFLVKKIKKVFFNMSDGIFLYGNYAKKLMIKEGFQENKLFVLHNSLQYSKQLKLRQSLSTSSLYREHFKNQFHNLIFIGRLTSVKKLDLLIEALSLLRNEGAIYNLTLIGDGIEKESLENLVIESGLKDNVWFYGACYDEKTNAELIYNADLCIAPGNVGLTAIHTLTFGTPVITQGNLSWQMPEFEAINKGITGDFFKQNNVQDLALCIKKWFDSKKDRDDIRKACYHEIDSFWTPDYQIGIMKRHLL